MRTVALVSLIILLAGCTSFSPAPVPTIPSLESAVPAEAGVVVASGILVPQREAELGFLVAGRVEAVQVSVGEGVRPGQVLVTLEKGSLQSDVAQGQAALRSAQARLALLQGGPRPEELAVAEARFRASEAALLEAIAQRDRLTGQEGITEAQARCADAMVWAAAAERDAAQAELDLLQAGPRPEELAAAEAGVAHAEAALEGARARLNQAVLRAPFAGTVIAVEAGLGETVMPGQTVLTLADLTRFEARVWALSEGEAAVVEIGQPVRVRIDALGIEVTGRVKWIAPQADDDSVTYAAAIELLQQPRGIRWGMAAEVTIVTGAAGGPLPVAATPTVTGDEVVFSQRRERMVIETIEARGITDERVLEAMRTVPRHLFVPEDERDHAYGDYPLPIGFGQTISQPYIVALMTELLELKPGDKVLEIGTGSGYQAAVLASIPGVEVYSIEIIPDLAQAAQQRLQQMGYRVECKQGDGYYGWPEHAPFNAIIVTAAPDHVPPPLLDQLAEGGRMVIPVGPPGGYQTLWKFVKEVGGQLRAYNMGGVAFVPFTGTGVQEHQGEGGYEWPAPW